MEGNPMPLDQMVDSAWSPGTPVGVRPGDAGERGAGKRLALEGDRLRGWKETVGDTGPRRGVGLPPAECAPSSCLSCSCGCPLVVGGWRPAMAAGGSWSPVPGWPVPELCVCVAVFELCPWVCGVWVSWTGAE